jgi:hypothetical protein
MKLEPGMRVRCVRENFDLLEGGEYTVSEMWASGTWIKLNEVSGGWLASRFKPVVRVKAPSRVLGSGVPDDAQPGDLVVGNRGAAARVAQPASQFGGLAKVLTLEHAGNYRHGARPSPGCKVYDFSGTDVVNLTDDYGAWGRKVAASGHSIFDGAR